MPIGRRRAPAICLALLLATATRSGAEDTATDDDEKQSPVGPIVSDPVRFSVSPPLWALPAIPPSSRREPVEPKERSIQRKGGPRTTASPAVTAAADDSIVAPPLPSAMPGVLSGFDTLVATDDPDGPWNPPDPTGEAGATQYVAAANVVFAVYDKANGNVLLTPRRINTVWQGFGGPCETTNEGDPIVLYDQLAGRWLLTQFTFGRAESECIAVSVTDDATGAWYRYEFVHPRGFDADYPKFGVWPDAYYMSTVDFSSGGAPATRCQPDLADCMGAFAFERDAMLAGNPLARQVYFQVPDAPDYWVVHPADVDGATPPPAGAPNWFVGGLWNTTNRLDVFAFDVDWATPANSTFAQVAQLAPPSWTLMDCAADWKCIPQPNGMAVDSMYDRTMMRLAYRNFGSHQSLVLDHVAKVGSRAAIRWYEFRNPGAGTTIHQSGTFAPADTLHRWMGSAAMDNDGNLAIGYSVSSAAVQPDIAWAGRLATDTLGALAQGESRLGIGAGSSSSSSGRWGDYTHLAIDPVDDCTFWYLNQYYTTTGGPWRLRASSFRFPSCTPPVAAGSLAPVDGLALVEGSGSSITATWDSVTCSDDHAVVLWGDLGAFGDYAGAVDAGCDLGSSGPAAFTHAASDVWFNVLWVSATNVAGHPGASSSGPRSWSAIGLCSIAADDHADPLCD